MRATPTPKSVRLGLAALLGFSTVTGTAGASTLIVLNKAEATASLIDLDSRKVVATVPTGTGPHEAAVSPDGKTAIAANYGGLEPGSSLTIIDVQSASVVRTIDLGKYRRPHGVRWMPDGRRAVITVEDNEAVIIVDVAEGKVTGEIPTKQKISHMVALSPDAKRAYVANIGSGTATLLDLSEMKAVRSVETGAGAEGIEVTPDGRHVWVTNRSADTVTVLDAETFEVVETIACASFPIRAASTPDGKHVLVTNPASGDMTVFDAASRKELRRVSLKLKAGDPKGRLFGDRFGDSAVPIGILVPPSGRHAFIALAGSDAIAMVDLKKWKMSDTFKAGKEPDGMAWSPLDVAKK